MLSCRTVFLIFIFLTIHKLEAQNYTSARATVDTLTSPFMWGRGYTNGGMGKAATFIENKFKSFGLLPVSSAGYQQPFTYSVNSFPGKVSLEINGIKLIPGKDYIVFPESGSIHTKGKLAQDDSVTFRNEEKKFVVKLVKKLTWSVSQQARSYAGVYLLQNALPQGMPATFKISVENREIKDFTAANVAAYVKGTTFPDSFMVITAHYDHLGGMGAKTYFPGANDNASGIALLLSLASYYSLNPPSFSIAFIAFAGEEAGLLGSAYYTEHPLFPLSNILFLINTDLAGTGEDGITVVNATEFPQAFKMLNEINDSLHLLKKINPRGKAANSDHYYFSEKGVPSIFFYTLGGIQAYHDIYDVSTTLPLNEHEDLIKLVTGFVGRWMNRNKK